VTKEKLKILKNGQWSLEKASDDWPPKPDRRQKAWDSYKEITKQKQYPIYGLNDSTKHWSSAGNSGDIADYGDYLSGHPTEKAGEHHNKFDAYPRVNISPNDKQSIFNHEHLTAIKNANNHSSFDPLVAPLGYMADESTHEKVDGKDTYHVYHGAPNGKFTHVGQYIINPKDNEVSGDTHESHRDMHDTIINAIRGLHYNTKAIAEHNKSFKEANPHLSGLRYSENGEMDKMFDDSFKHFLKTGKATSFSPDLHREYLKNAGISNVDSLINVAKEHSKLPKPSEPSKSPESPKLPKPKKTLH
jgi:hypothetical protein